MDGIKGLANELITFSEGGTPVTKIVDLNDLVRQAVKFGLSGSNIDCEYLMSEENCPVEIDEDQVNQVINNLVANAQQAMPGGGKIKVSVQKVEIDKNVSLPATPGSFAKLCIQDHGPGIPEEDRARVFDPFYSTKPTGTGLGLATSHSIIQKHGGHISVESELGIGTKFHVYLPAPDIVINERANEDAELTKGKGSILVMDDQEQIRGLIEMFLKKLGYSAVTSADGAEALEKYKDAMGSGNPFNAVILDLTIPGGMGGSETIKRLMEIDPGVTA